MKKEPLFTCVIFFLVSRGPKKDRSATSMSILRTVFRPDGLSSVSPIQNVLITNPEKHYSEISWARKLWKEHDCTKYGVTSNKTMMSSCKLVVVFDRGIPLKHNVLMCYSKIINISLKVMINDWLILGNIIVYQRLFLSSRSFQRINQKLLFKF